MVDAQKPVSDDMKMSVGKTTLFYILILVAVTIAIALLGWALERFFGLNAGSGLGLVGVMIAAMSTGQLWVSKAKVEPTKAEAWKFGLIFTLVSAVFSALLLGVILSADEELKSIFSQLGSTFAAIVGLIALLLILLVSRFAFSWGARTTLKALDKKKG